MNASLTSLGGALTAGRPRGGGSPGLLRGSRRGLMSLAAFLGHPPPGAALGMTRSPLWAAVRASIQAGLPQGLPRVRSPLTLWELVRGRTAPRGAAWGALCEGLTPDSLYQALRAVSRAPAARVASWNARWLRSPHTHRGTGKKRELQQLLQNGTIMAVQETHWSLSDIAIWGGLFLERR